MTLLSEKITVTAKEYLQEKNINDCKELNEPLTQAKISVFNWDMQFAAASLGCEMIWKMACTRGNSQEWRQLNILFSPSPVSTYCNFRGCKDYKTGNAPEEGALVFWRRGNSWQGHMAVVINVSSDKQSFDIIEVRVQSGSDSNFLTVLQQDGKKIGLPFRADKLNLLGFVYAKNKEID